MINQIIMSKKRYFSEKILLSFIILALIICNACNENRNVVPNDFDSSDVFSRLKPNEEVHPGVMTFGPDSISGFDINLEIPSDTAEIYINFQQLTFVDANPSISENILDFISTQLRDFGFMNDSVSGINLSFAELIKNGKSQQEVVGEYIKNIESEFLKQLPEIKQFEVPYNIVFDIYPVYINRDYVTFLQSAYCYTGGAHGNTIKKLITYNLSTGTALTLFDIVKPEGLRQVREEVAAHMAFSYPIYDNITSVDQYIDSLNVWTGGIQEGDVSEKITYENFPLPNPALNETGLVFVYPMYELTPGSDGCPVVVIPFSELKGCLKNDITK